MARIGITGGIGSGKSVVSGILRGMGYDVYDSDREAQRLMCTDEGIREALTERFGREVYAGGVLNRRLLARLIFGNRENIEFVNRTVHPVVCRDFAAWAEGREWAFVESAILFEAKMDEYVDRIIYVDAPVELRIRRVMMRDNASEEEVRRRIENQLPAEVARGRAHFIINNDGTEELIPQIEQCLMRNV